ncbi:MAG: hypothetical protein ACXVP5_01330 [Tumebacillaceae bacterium]
MPNNDISRVVWYIENRIEFLQKQQDKLRGLLEVGDPQTTDFDALAEFMENKGRVKELKSILDNINRYSEGDALTR